MEFYVYLNGVKRGPFREAEVQSYLAAALLQPTDLAANQADGDWKPLSAFQRFALDAPSLATSAAPEIPLPAVNGPRPTRSLPPADAPDFPRTATTAAPGPYARSVLAPNERVYHTTALHWIVFARFAVLGAVLFLFAAIPFAIGVQALTGSELGWFVLPFPAFILLPPTIAFASNEIVITERRILIKTGFISRQSTEMFIPKVESIAVEQNFLGRIFDYGTVIVRGTGGSEEAFDSIARPLLFRNWVQRVQNGDLPGSSGNADASAVAVLAS